MCCSGHVFTVYEKIIVKLPIKSKTQLNPTLYYTLYENVLIVPTKEVSAPQNSEEMYELLPMKSVSGDQNDRS